MINGFGPPKWFWLNSFVSGWIFLVWLWYNALHTVNKQKYSELPTSTNKIFVSVNSFIITSLWIRVFIFFVWWELLLPACEFGGEFAEQVRGGPAASIGWQGSSVMTEGGRRGRRSIGGRYTVTELTPVKGAPDGGSTCQPTALTWGRGGGCSRSNNTESRGRGGREAVRQRAEERQTQTVNESQTVHCNMQHSDRVWLRLWMCMFVTCCLCRSAAASVGQWWNDLYIRTCFCGSSYFLGYCSARKTAHNISLNKIKNINTKQNATHIHIK